MELWGKVGKKGGKESKRADYAKRCGERKNVRFLAR